MKTILKMAWKDLRKKKSYTLLLLVVCMIAMNTVIDSITNATADKFQQKVFERNIGSDLDSILHLDYHRTDETQAFANLLPEYLQYISELDGVVSVGQFDVSGTYFSELRAMDRYAVINAQLQTGGYERTPNISRVLFADESILSLCKTGIAEYMKPTSGNLPLIVGESFKDVLPIGTILTEERTNTQYEVTGYLPMGKHWVDENDLIRFPLVSMDGWVIAPFPPQDKTDIMTQLSCLQNTYILISDHADIGYLQTAIEEYSLSHGFHATAINLRDEYDAYQQETAGFATRQIALAVFISIMAMSSIVAVFTTNAILKQGQYGIYLANGFTRKDIALSIITEIMILILPSTALVWIRALFHLMCSDDIGIVMFWDVLLTAHYEYTLPICIVCAIVVGTIASLLPTIKVLRYQPCELIGGNGNGNN